MNLLYSILKSHMIPAYNENDTDTFPECWILLEIILFYLYIYIYIKNTALIRHSKYLFDNHTNVINQTKKTI